MLNNEKRQQETHWTDIIIRQQETHWTVLITVKKFNDFPVPSRDVTD